jgi:hypothetical protein
MPRVTWNVTPMVDIELGASLIHIIYDIIHTQNAEELKNKRMH